MFNVKFGSIAPGSSGSIVFFRQECHHFDNVSAAGSVIIVFTALNSQMLPAACAAAPLEKTPVEMLAKI